MKYHFFKVQFKAANEGRKLSQVELALRLHKHLKGKPEKLVETHLHTNLGESTYTLMWKLLDNRYGGDHLEDSYVTNMFEKAPILESFTVSELERMFDVLTTQLVYYEREDPNSLENPKSLLMRETKKKFTSVQSVDYLDFCSKVGCSQNFRSIYRWVSQKLKTVSRAEKEFAHTRMGGANREDDTFTSDMENDVDPKDQQIEELKDKVTELTTMFHRFSGIARTGKGLRNQKQTGKVSFGETETQKLRTDGCPICKSLHDLASCEKFKILNVRKRQKVVQKTKYCYHCLKGSHRIRDCKTDKNLPCGVEGCARYHHPLIHPEESVKGVNFEDRDSNCSELTDVNFD
jgi:hypothetical protein